MKPDQADLGPYCLLYKLPYSTSAEAQADGTWGQNDTILKHVTHMMT